MPLVEMVRGRNTPAELFDRACGLIFPHSAKRSSAWRRTCRSSATGCNWRCGGKRIRLVQDGVASAADVDLVARQTFALRLPAIGPLENIDLVGLDLVNETFGYLLPTLADDHSSPQVLKDQLAAGRSERNPVRVSTTGASETRKKRPVAGIDRFCTSYRSWTPKSGRLR